MTTKAQLTQLAERVHASAACGALGTSLYLIATGTPPFKAAVSGFAAIGVIATFMLIVKALARAAECGE
jgi:hypothetical protein